MSVHRNDGVTEEEIRLTPKQIKALADMSANDRSNVILRQTHHERGGTHLYALFVSTSRLAHISRAGRVVGLCPFP